MVQATLPAPVPRIVTVSALGAEKMSLVLAGRAAPFGKVIVSPWVGVPFVWQLAQLRGSLQLPLAGDNPVHTQSAANANADPVPASRQTDTARTRESVLILVYRHTLAIYFILS